MLWKLKTVQHFLYTMHKSISEMQIYTTWRTMPQVNVTLLYTSSNGTQICALSQFDIFTSLILPQIIDSLLKENINPLALMTLHKKES